MSEPLTAREAPANYLVERALVPSGYKCPKGYKQIEVGVMPEDWDTEKLGKPQLSEQGLLAVLFINLTTLPKVPDDGVVSGRQACGYLQPVGQKTPRVDLYLLILHTIIEVKYRKDTKKSFQTLIGEIADDASLYRADAKYKDARIVGFLWDCTRATQEHAKFQEGVLKIGGINGCVVISTTSTMDE